MAYLDQIQLLDNAQRAGHAFEGAQRLHCVNASGAALTPGRLLIKTGVVGMQPQVKHPETADFTAKAYSWAISNWTTGEAIEIAITFRGATVSVPVPFDTDEATSLALAVARANAIMDSLGAAGRTILWSVASTTITATVEVAGEDFDARILPINPTGGNLAVGTRSTAGSALVDVVVGWALDEGAAILSSAGASELPDGRGVSACVRGRCGAIMAAAGATSQGDDMYVLLSSTPGAITATEAAARVWIPDTIARWLNAAATSTTDPRGAVALIEVR